MSFSTFTPDDRREAALTYLRLDYREQVVGDIRLAGEVRVSRDVEGLARLDVHPREQKVEVARNHLLQRDESITAPDTEEARDSGTDRHLDAGGGRRLLLLVVQRHEQVEREVRDEGERVRRVDRLGRHQGHDVLDVVVPQAAAFLLVQVRVIENLDSVFGEATQHLGEDALLAPLDLRNDVLSLVNLLLRRAAVDRQLLNAGPDLLLETADALHEELVEIGAHDGEELDPFEQRRSFVLGFVQHPAVELEPGEFAVQVQRRVLQVDLGRR